MDSDKTSEVAGTYSARWVSTVGPALWNATVAIQTNAPDALEVVERGSLALESMDLIYVGHNLGLTEIHDHTTLTNGWSKFYDTTRQTMLMPNAIDTALMLDETTGTQAQDVSFNNTDMAIKGTPVLAASGVRGKGLNLNGASYLCSDANQDNTCDNDTSLNMSTTGFTIGMWFKHSTTAPATPQVLFEKCYNTTPAATTGCVVAYMTTTGTIVGAIDATTTFTQFTTYDVTATSSQTYHDNQWHFLVMSRTNANDMDVFIDGQALNLSNATGQTATVDAANQVVSIGASCAGSANCATGANFWDGSIDDFHFSNGTTTVATVSGAQQRRLYNDSRPLVNKRVVTVDNATTATSTTIGDSGETWIPNEFAGLVMTITGGTGSGQSRRVTGNTATTLTVSPAFDTAPDTTSDFEVDPEALYGASNIVNAVGITAESPLGEARMMCAGTNSGTDTGGVTCYNHQAGPNVVAEVFHADAKKLDDSDTEWTGTDYDDIKSIDLSGRSLIIGSQGHLYTRTEDVRLGQGLDYLANQLFNIRGEMILDGITAAGSIGLEVGFTGGADLAERYYSNEPLEAGEVVAIDNSLGAGVKKSENAYQKDVIGIVATSPGIVLGNEQENAYPVALAGRVPVKVTNENGPVYTGDRITASSRPGYAMRAAQAGRVLGTALSDTTDWTVCEGEDPANSEAILCATAFVFVNLSDYYGMPVELAMTERDATLGADGLSGTASLDGSEQGLGSDTASIRLATAMPTKQEGILNFLKELRDTQASTSEIFAGRVAVSGEVITPTLYADTIFAKSIKADSIEGLEIFTNQLGSLDAKYQELSQSVTVAGEGDASNLKMLTLDSAEVKLALNVLGTLTARGGIVVGGDAEFNGDTVFNKLATFFGLTTFKDGVLFEKTPTFSKDTAGFAVIKEGQRTVTVAFEDTYAKQPIVSVTPTNERSALLDDDDISSEVKADIKAVEADFREAYFNDDVKYLITNKSQKGFTIVLNKPATRELTFSWVALSVSNGSTFYSEDKPEQITEDAKEEEEVEVVQDETSGDISPEPPSEESTGGANGTETSIP